MYNFICYFYDVSLRYFTILQFFYQYYSNWMYKIHGDITIIVIYLQKMTVVILFFSFSLKSYQIKLKENGCCFKVKNKQLFKDPNKVNRIPCSNKLYCKFFTFLLFVFLCTSLKSQSVWNSSHYNCVAVKRILLKAIKWLDL